MIRKYLPVLFIIATVLISGCVGSKPSSTTTGGSFAGGTQGLALSFVQNAPPPTYPEVTAFDIDVQLENKGESTVKSGDAKIILGGVSTAAYGLKSNSQSNAADLAGRQKLGSQTAPGGQDIVTFSSTGSQNFPGDQPVTFIATACYPYSTEATATICIQQSLAKQITGGSQVCTVTGDKAVSNSGAPVQVTTISQFPIGSPISGLTFNIQVKDVGGGTAYAPGATCPDLAFSDKKVKITKMHLINLNIDADCVGKLVTLTNGQGFTSCKVTWKPEDIQGAFEDVLDIGLDYGYTESITTKTTFQNIPT